MVNASGTDAHSQPHPVVGGDRALLQFVKTAMRLRRGLLVNTVIVTVLALLLSLVLPQWFKSTASILPPKEGSGLGLSGLNTSLLKNLGGIGKIAGSTSSAALYNYLAILKSRTIQEAIVRKFDLVHVYDVSDQSVEKAIRELQDNVTFDLQNEDYLTIEVFDRDPRRAAAIANEFVDELNRVSIRLSTQEAANNRIFIEGRLDTVRRDLQIAEDALAAFQEKNSILVTADPQSAGVSAVADLYALKAKKELEVSLLKNTLGPENPALRAPQLELQELDKKVAALPMLGLEGLRLLRDVLVQQRILEYMIPMYEQAKVEEQKDVPALLVLDHAVPAEKKAKPKRIYVVLSGFALSLLVGLGYVLWRMSMENLQAADPKAHGELVHAAGQLRGDIRSIAARLHIGKRS